MSRKKYQHNEKTLGGRLRKFRNEKGIGVIDFSKLLNISQASLSDYENNKTPISYEAIVNLKQNTDINIEWLLFGVGEMIDQGAECDTLINKVGVFEDDPETIDLLEMARGVLNSGTDYSHSLAANIRSFHNAVKTEKRVNKMEDEIAELKMQIRELQRKPAIGE